MGIHVGVVSSHGHEDGHILVWDKLPEVESSPRLHHSRRGGHRRHLVPLDQGRLQEPQPAGAPEQAPRRRGCLRPARPGPAHPADDRRCGRAGPVRQARVHQSGRHAGGRRASRVQGRHGRHDVPVALLRFHPGSQEGPRRGRPGRAVCGGDADAHVPAQVPPSLARTTSSGASTPAAASSRGSAATSSTCLNFITGDHIVEVTAMTGNQNPEPVDVEDTAMVAFRMAGGVNGHPARRVPHGRPRQESGRLA